MIYNQELQKIALVMSRTLPTKSNTTVTDCIPAAMRIVGTMAMLNEWTPLPVLFAITVVTSFAFLLPMGTPPNALIYEKAQIPIKAMVKHGMVLNIMVIGLITTFTILVSTNILI